LFDTVAGVRSFRGIAVADGTLKVDVTGASAFNWSFVRTLTGELNAQGAALVDKSVMIKDGKAEVPIAAGQEYVIVGGNNAKVDGAKTGVVKVADGTRLTINVRGEVYKPNGLLKYGPYGGVALKPGMKTVVEIPFEVDGNTATKVSMIGATGGSAGISVGPIQSVSVGAKGKGTIKVPITVGPNAPDWDGVLKYKISAFDGAAAGPVDIPLKVETRWAVWPEWTLKAGDLTHKGSLKVSDTGIYSVYNYFSSDAWITVNSVRFMVLFNTPKNSQGQTHGFEFAGGIGAMLDKGLENWNAFQADGVDATIAAQPDKLIGGGITYVLSSNDAKFNAIKQSKNFAGFIPSWQKIGGD
ncbi:MAG: hypothetical protein MH204_07250, partial [Fimbriimonadaceae bacterium]|nr:hypothetical protein [Fimbriimonadaceae bacterium]